MDDGFSQLLIDMDISRVSITVMNMQYGSSSPTDEDFESAERLLVVLRNELRVKDGVQEITPDVVPDEHMREMLQDGLNKNPLKRKYFLKADFPILEKVIGLLELFVKNRGLPSNMAKELQVSFTGLNSKLYLDVNGKSIKSRTKSLNRLFDMICE